VTNRLNRFSTRYGRPIRARDTVPADQVPPRPPATFQTTAWSVVRAAAGQPTTGSRHALATLCQTYWHPVYAFVRRSGYSRDHAEDLTQAFFARLLEKHFLRDVDQRRGRFRSFLLAAVKHFLANEWDRSTALKRGGGLTPVSIDALAAEAWYAPAAVEEMTPERLFERRWALSLIDHAMIRLGADYSAQGRIEQFDRLKGLLTGDADARYETLAAEMGVTAGALRMSAHRLRRKYRQAIRDEIAETVSTQDEIDEEIQFLMSVV
jgi:DNA-directed RNA polymerase specialized sigma24 family protein